MGELIFTICYGGALIVLGFVTKAFLKKMERDASQKNIEDHSIPPQKNIHL